MPKFIKGTIINDRFLLIECLGTGIFSQVWRAIDETLDTEVALKIYAPLTPDGMKELKREYGNTIGVSHQNLLTPQGMDVCNGGAYLVMKCCSKGSADTLAGMVDERVVWHFVHDVAAGLAYLHGLDEPIIHQDMKLANIMIDDDDRFLISDFGICYKVTQIMVRQTGRGRSAAMAYMSPERFSADYDLPLTSSDIWTLGALIYELCTGVPPFGDFGGAAQHNGQLPPKLPRGWSKELQMLCQACMQLNTWDRPKATKIREFASQMLKNQHPAPDVLGIASPSPQPADGYTRNTPEMLFGQLAADQSSQAHDSDSALPAYMTLGQDSGVGSGATDTDTHTQVSDGFERIGAKDENAHFTSGTRYRTRGQRGATRHVHKHRTPVRKAYDWLKSKSSYLSFLLIVAICAWVYWYGLDNLLSLKFLPEKDTQAGAVTETVQPVDDINTVVTSVVEIEDTASAPDGGVRPVNNLPTPPPPREHKGISPIGRTAAYQAPGATAHEDKQPGTNPGPQNPAPAPTAPVEKQSDNKPVAENNKQTPDKTAPVKKTQAPKPSELEAAVQKGNYDAIKRMADGGSAAAAGVMAKKYLHDNNHAAADEYARMAKKGGDPAGDEVINKLKVQGYYQ